MVRLFWFSVASARPGGSSVLSDFELCLTGRVRLSVAGACIADGRFLGAFPLLVGDGAGAVSRSAPAASRCWPAVLFQTGARAALFQAGMPRESRRSSSFRCLSGWSWACLGVILSACASAPPPSPPTHGFELSPEPQVSDEPAPAGASAVELRYPPSRTPWLGVEIEDQPSGTPGVRIVRVLRGSPAADGQLRAGDELLSVGGTRLDAPSDLVQTLERFGVGAEVPLAVLRAGQHRVFRVSLRGQPEFEDLLRLAFVGSQAPTISGVVTFQGEAASLTELRGKVVLLEFWASWCEVCRYLAPVLGRWQREYRPAGLEVVGVTIDPPDVAAKAASRVGMAYTLASDTGGEVSDAYLANQIPAVFVIDRRGIVVDVMVGVQSRRLDEVHELVGRLLDENEGERGEGFGG